MWVGSTLTVVIAIAGTALAGTTPGDTELANNPRAAPAGDPGDGLAQPQVRAVPFGSGSAKLDALSKLGARE